MAQSYLVNAATRLHPVEWSSGVAAGVVAAFMAREKIDSTTVAFGSVKQIRGLTEKYAPSQWLIDGILYPSQS